MPVRVLLVCCLMLLNGLVFGQNLIEGRIVEAQTNAPIKGAFIAAVDTQEHAGLQDTMLSVTYTDSTGYFSLLLADGANEVMVRMLEYTSVRVSLDQLPSGANSFLVIPLQLLPEEERLLEVVAFPFVSPIPFDQLYKMEINLDVQQIETTVSRPGYSTSIIGWAELQRNDPISITPYLNRVPGVFMHSGALNTNRITIRGIGARSPFSTTKIRAYLEDIPLTSGDGETSLEDLDLGFVNQIEVSRGPSSSVYGAGLGGLIKLSLPNSAYQPSVKVSGMYSAFGTYRGQVALGNQSEDKTRSYWFSASHQHSDGYRENNEYDRTSAAFATQLKVGKKKTGQDKVVLLGTFVRLNAEIPSSLDSTNFADNPTAAAFTWNRSNGREASQKGNLGLSYRKHLTDDQVWVTSIFGAFRQADEVRPFNLLRESSLTAGTRMRYLAQGELAGRFLEATAGVEAFQEWYNWQTYQNTDGMGTRGSVLSDNAEERQFVNGFAHVLWFPVEQGQLTLGTNVNFTRYLYSDYFLEDSIDQSGTYSFSPILSPKIAFRYQTDEAGQFFAQVAHGFSPPSVSETLTPDGALNPDIQPETGWNYELGWQWRNYRGFTAQVSVFLMDVRNLLVPRRTDFDTYVGVNAGRTRHAGLESDLSYTLRHVPFNLTIWSQYTLAAYQFTDFFDEELDQRVDGNLIPGIPQHHLTSGIDFEKRGIRINLSSEYSSRMAVDNANTVFNAAYFLLHLKASYELKLYPNQSTSHLTVYLGANNLTDTRYASMLQVNAQGFGGGMPRYFYPGLPRHLYGGLSWRLR